MTDFEWVKDVMKVIDFILTSDVLVQVGQTVTFEGLITTHKDFGSGYFYDLIMEEAVPIK